MTGPEAIQTAFEFDAVPHGHVSGRSFRRGFAGAAGAEGESYRLAIGASHHLGEGSRQGLPAGRASFPNCRPASTPSTARKPLLVEPPKGFLTKAKYLELFNATRQAVIEATKKLSQTDLDKPTTGPMSQWAPTVGHLLLMTSNHTMMHAGQFTAVRRP